MPDALQTVQLRVIIGMPRFSQIRKARLLQQILQNTDQVRMTVIVLPHENLSLTHVVKKVTLNSVEMIEMRI